MAGMIRTHRHKVTHPKSFAWNNREGDWKGGGGNLVEMQMPWMDGWFF